MQRNVRVPDSAGCLRQSQWQPVIPRADSPREHPETRDSATGCPGVAASSPVLLSGAGTGCWPPQRLQVRDRKIADRQLASASAVLSFERARGLAGWSSHGAASAVTRAGQEHTNDAVRGWLALGPHSSFWRVRWVFLLWHSRRQQFFDCARRLASLSVVFRELPSLSSARLRLRRTGRAVATCVVSLALAQE